ncbi:hypothetical protein [Ectobacillus polymachus]|uniref:hypothetical protein n=1 Tax=Ectobacillus polymachus TaxID=1508806 RepID=UPI003A849B7B
MKNNFRLFFIVLLCSIFVFAVQVGAKALLMKLFDTSYAYAANTFVGPISLEKKVKEQAQVELQQQITTWKASPHVQLQYGETEFSVPADLFSFDITDSVHNIKNGQHSLLTVHIVPNNLDMLLSDQLNPEIADQIDKIKLEQDLARAASSLESKTTIQVMKYIDVQKAKKTVSQATATSVAPYQAELQQWVSQYANLTIPAKSQMSVTDLATKKGLSIDDDALSVISSLINETIQPTNFQIRQRNTSIALPAYAKLGSEAYIEKGKSDFVFYNPNDSDYTFQFTLQNNSLSLSLQGLPLVYTYVANRNEVQSISAKEIQQIIIQNEAKNDAITAERKGHDGYAVNVYREQYKSGNLMKRDKIAQDFYLQVNGVKNVQVAAPQPTVQNPPVTDPAQTNQTQQSQTNGQTSSTTNKAQQDQSQPKGK